MNVPLHYFFDLTSFYMRQKSLQNFCWFFKDTLRTFEINWPLLCQLVWIFFSFWVPLKVLYWIFFDLWITFLPLASCLIRTFAVFVLSSNALIYWSPMATFPFISFKWFVAAFFLSTFWIRTCVFLICCHLDFLVLLLSNNK